MIKVYSMTAIMDLSFPGQRTTTATSCIPHDSVYMPGPRAGKSADTWLQLFQNDSKICEVGVTLTPLINKICKPWRLLSESTGVSFQKKLFTLSSTQESNTRLLLTEHNKPELVTQYVISEFSPRPQATSQNVLFLCSPKRAARPLITSVFETCKKIMSINSSSIKSRHTSKKAVYLDKFSLTTNT